MMTLKMRRNRRGRPVYSRDVMVKQLQTWLECGGAMPQPPPGQALSWFHYFFQWLERVNRDHELRRNRGQTAMRMQSSHR
jgi:hypothetical protein